jgi:hypothetical protein
MFFLIPAGKVAQIIHLLFFQSLSIKAKKNLKVIKFTGWESKNPFKKNANSLVILVPLTTKFQSLNTIFPVVSLSHLRLLRFRKHGFPLSGKSGTSLSSKNLGRSSN